MQIIIEEYLKEYIGRTITPDLINEIADKLLRLVVVSGPRVTNSK